MTELTIQPLEESMIYHGMLVPIHGYMKGATEQAATSNKDVIVFFPFNGVTIFVAADSDTDALLRDYQIAIKQPGSIIGPYPSQETMDAMHAEHVNKMTMANRMAVDLIKFAINTESDDMVVRDLNTLKLAETELRKQHFKS